MILNGYKVISSDHMTETKFTKKQTRKFKNKRWVKKYLKMHSYQEARKDFMISETHNTIIGHPSMIQQLRLQAMDTDNCFML